MKNKTSGGVIELAKTLLYAVIIAVVIRTVLYEPFNIPSGSMEPTLLVGDYLFVSKFSYGYSRYSLPLGYLFPSFGRILFFHEPERGDVIVFMFPRNPSEHYIKRLIGLPGDKIQVIEGTLYINDVATKRVRDGMDLDSGPRERWIETLPNGVQHPILLRPREYPTPPARCDRENGDSGDAENTCPFKVPPGHYFMMGDNRDNSDDSRVATSGVGMVPAENLVGRAEIIFFSTNGDARWWEVWNWPFTIRWERLLKVIR
ncbi:MAG TPA: signal peptidase I [Stellaceae bacterium]|nr:signal peptidase I [Stellaceae bacterium]